MRPQKQKKLLLAIAITALLASSTVFHAPAATTTRAPCPRKSRAHSFSPALTPNLASGLSVDLKNGKNEIQIPFFDLSPSAASDTSYHKNYSRESRLTHRWPHSDVPVYSLTTREQDSSELPPCSPLLRSISSNSLCDVPMCDLLRGLSSESIGCGSLEEDFICNVPPAPDPPLSTSLSSLCTVQPAPDPLQTFSSCEQPKRKRPKLQQLIFDSPSADAPPAKKQKPAVVRRRNTKWCKEPHFSQMRSAVIAVRFRKESSTVISSQTGIPARTIRRYVGISKDPKRAHDSPFYMSRDPSHVTDTTYRQIASPTFTPFVATVKDQQQKKIDNLPINIDPSEEAVLNQLDSLYSLDSLCSTDEMSTVLEGFDDFLDEVDDLF